MGSKIKGKDQIIFEVIGYILVFLFALACVIPFYLIIMGSFTKESTIVTTGYKLWLTAKDFSTEAYAITNLFSSKRVYMIEKNTYCVIFAGGKGRRLWPCSREVFPKQFIDFFG
ncbi:MAG: hypothetical protein IIT65_13060, partial [Lachnospiraceae bacterium]|nr:hypothetical protein [Lachnospiraceae bacterium]